MKPLTAQQVERILKANGFRHDRTNGSHWIWDNGAGRSVPVPHHGWQESYHLYSTGAMRL